MALAELAPGVHRIDGIGLSQAISLLLFRDGDGWTLVDTGIGGSAARVRSALAALGAGPASLHTIYLTHHHSDHVGGLAKLRQWAPDARVKASSHEAEILRGERPPDRFSSPLIRRISGGAAPPRVADCEAVPEGTLLAGWRLVNTPGHTLGHTSLVNDSLGILFTGDAFGTLPFKLRVGVRPGLCADPKLARRSAEMLLEEPYETVIFSHGKTIREGAQASLRNVLAECRY